MSCFNSWFRVVLYSVVEGIRLLCSRVKQGSISGCVIVIKRILLKRDAQDLFIRRWWLIQKQPSCFPDTITVSKTSSNQRLRSVFHRNVIMANWVVFRKANRKLWLCILSTLSGLDSMYTMCTKTRPKTLGKKNLERRPICSRHKKSQFQTPAKQKLGCAINT